MPPSDGMPEGLPPWDQDEADWLIGKYALVGLTFLAADGETVKKQVQFHGTIVRADKGGGIVIELRGNYAGQTTELPPDLGAFSLADPGDYRLHSTREVVSNPDVVASWSITEPSKS